MCEYFIYDEFFATMHFNLCNLCAYFFINLRISSQKASANCMIWECILRWVSQGSGGNEKRLTRKILRDTAIITPRDRITRSIVRCSQFGPAPYIFNVEEIFSTHFYWGHKSTSKVIKFVNWNQQVIYPHSVLQILNICISLPQTLSWHTHFVIYRLENIDQNSTDLSDSFPSKINCKFHN